MAIPILSDVGIKGGLTIDGDFGFLQQTPTTVTPSSGVHTINFSTVTNHYAMTTIAGNNSIAFSGLGADSASCTVKGQQGTITITNPSSGTIAWPGSQNLPTTAYSPGGSTITFNTANNGLAVLTYFILDYNKVLINYVGGFAPYGA